MPRKSERQKKAGLLNLEDRRDVGRREQLERGPKKINCRVSGSGFDDGSSNRAAAPMVSAEWLWANGLRQRGSKCAMEVVDDAWGSFAAVTSVWSTIRQRFFSIRLSETQLSPDRSSGITSHSLASKMSLTGCAN